MRPLQSLQRIWEHCLLQWAHVLKGKFPSIRAIQTHSDPFKAIQSHSLSFRTVKSISRPFRAIQSHSFLFCRDFKKVESFMKEKFGCWMEVGSKGVKDTCNELGLHHASETVECLTNAGVAVQRTLSYVTDLPAFFHAIAMDEKVSDAVIVSGDGGEGKLLITATVIYEGQVGDDEEDAFAQIYVLAMIDGADENRHNFELMLKKLGFPLQETGRISFRAIQGHSEPFRVIQSHSLDFLLIHLLAEIQVITDLKLLAIILGLHGNQCMHNCPYGFCYKVDEKGRKNGNRGRYTVSSELRTIFKCHYWFNKWMEAGGNPNHLKNFMSQAKLPIDIFRAEDYAKAILLLNPPMILHLFLGIFGFYIQSHSESFRAI